MSYAKGYNLGYDRNDWLNDYDGDEPDEESEEEEQPAIDLAAYARAVRNKITLYRFFKLLLNYGADEGGQQSVLAIAEAAVEKAGGAESVLGPGQTFKGYWEKRKSKFEKEQRQVKEANEAWLRGDD